MFLSRPPADLIKGLLVNRYSGLFDPYISYQNDEAVQPKCKMPAFTPIF